MQPSHERTTTAMQTILLADDTPSVREFCRQELEDDGYRVVLARDGSEGVALMGREHPDVVVLDISMPVMDGLEAAERIKAMQPQMPVIFFTLYDDAATRDARGRLAAAVVEKSEDLTELKRAIARSLRIQEAASARERFGLPTRLDPGDLARPTHSRKPSGGNVSGKSL